MQKKTNGNLWLIVMAMLTLAAGAFAAGANQGVDLGGKAGKISGYKFDDSTRFSISR